MLDLYSSISDNRNHTGEILFLYVLSFGAILLYDLGDFFVSFDSPLSLLRYVLLILGSPEVQHDEKSSNKI